jgi:hypothetical protein
MLVHYVKALRFFPNLAQVSKIYGLMLAHSLPDLPIMNELIK